VGPFETIYDETAADVGDFVQGWTTFRRLSRNKHHVDVLNRVSPSFFGLLQAALRSYCVSIMARLLERPIAAGKKTASMPALFSVAPVAGTPALVCNGRDEYVVFAKAIQHGIRKPIQNKPSFAASALRPPQWCFDDTLDGVIDFEGERLSSNFTALAIPVLRVGQLLIGLAMKPDAHHARRNNFALTSSHGRVWTAPDSISRQRLSASSAQSSSTSGSGGGSRLSMSRPARVARSPSDSSNASRNISRRSRAMRADCTPHDESTTYTARTVPSLAF
jgi:hypothetical protein